MKKVISLIMTLVLMLSVWQIPIMASTNDEEMRAVWISTVYNLDYPSTKNNITAQQNEFIEKLDALKEVGINAVFIQVRPKADALYRSAINPWSDVLTGVQGKDPGYDPLAFMVEAAHSRGMEIHAWLNPYRVTTKGTDLSALASSHPARLNASWTFSYNDALYYNPELEEVKQHIVDTVTEIAMQYNVDGIHFDDYFYPSSYPLPAGEGKDGSVASARRWAINDMVSRVSTAIKGVNRTYGKNITFGISPAGIWKNNTSDVTGSATSGNEAYYSVYADARAWIQNGWVDYIAPQIYWVTGHAKADYETLVKWWSNEVKGTKVKLYIGQGIYTDAVANQIDTQLQINQKYEAVKGSIYFSLRDLLNNRMQCKDKIAGVYKANPVTGSGNNGNTNTSPSTSGELKVDPQAVGKTGTVMATTLNIRAGARTDRPVVAKVASGTQVSILSILGNWYKVRLNDGLVGWASAGYIQVGGAGNPINPPTSNNPPVATFPRAGKVTATTLNIRSGARIDRPLMTKVTKGTTLTLVSQLGDWYKVRLSNGTVGWCVKSYIS